MTTILDKLDKKSVSMFLPKSLTNKITADTLTMQQVHNYCCHFFFLEYIPVCLFFFKNSFTWLYFHSKVLLFLTMDFIYAENIIVLLIYVIYFVPVSPKNIETVFLLFFLDLVIHFFKGFSKTQNTWIIFNS